MTEKKDLTVKELYDLLGSLLDEYGDLEVVVSYNRWLVATPIKPESPQIVLQPRKKYSRVCFEGY